MATAINAGVELKLEDIAIDDRVRDVLGQGSVVYDFHAEELILKLSSLLPDGNVGLTKLATKSNLSVLAEELEVERLLAKDIPQAEFRFRDRANQEQRIRLRLDPRDPARYFVRFGDGFVLAGRKVQPNPFPVGWVVAGALGAGALGLGAYAISEGFDVDVGIQISDWFFLGFKADKKAEERGESG